MGNKATPLIERRYIPIDEEFRLNSESNTLEGMAAKFNEPSDDLGGFEESIRAGAFKKTIKEADVRCLFNHDPNYILGRNKNGTLELKENKIGLAYANVLPDTSYAKDLKVSIGRGDVSQCSFGFQTIKDDWSDDYRKRELIEVRLFDVSPVTYPAYPQTEVKLRSALLDMGIDYNALNLIILKSSRGIVMNSEDTDRLNETIKILSEFLPVTEPIEINHSSDDESFNDTLVRMAINKRRMKALLRG